MPLTAGYKEQHSLNKVQKRAEMTKSLSLYFILQVVERSQDRFKYLKWRYQSILECLPWVLLRNMCVEVRDRCHLSHADFNVQRYINRYQNSSLNLMEKARWLPEREIFLVNDLGNNRPAMKRKKRRETDCFSFFKVVHFKVLLEAKVL